MTSQVEQYAAQFSKAVSGERPSSQWKSVSLYLGTETITSLQLLDKAMCTP